MNRAVERSPVFRELNPPIWTCQAAPEVYQSAVDAMSVQCTSSLLATSPETCMTITRQLWPIPSTHRTRMSAHVSHAPCRLAMARVRRYMQTSMTRFAQLLSELMFLLQIHRCVCAGCLHRREGQHTHGGVSGHYTLTVFLRTDPWPSIVAACRSSIIAVKS
jgi:hypothetical protein